MIISNIINDSFGLLSKQLRFYCWHFRRNLDQCQRQELVDLLHEQHFERLANKIRALDQTTIADCKQQVSKLLFEQCLRRDRRHQLKQLIESRLLDVNVRLDNYGRTLLHRSAYNLDVELVKLLIDEGVNIRLRDYAGNTALHIAIQSYRNGAVLYGNESEVVQNLTNIVKLLLVADRERYKRKRKRLINEIDNKSATSPPNRGIDMDEETIGDGDDDDYHDNLSKRSAPDSPLMGSKSNNNSSSSAGKRDSVRCNNSNDNDTQQSKQQTAVPSIDDSAIPLNPILLEDDSSSLLDTKNAFGRTALHYCVLVVGEKHLDHFVKLLISFGADIDAIDTRMKTPLYCLVKRPGVSAIRQKCLAISHLLDNGCDDLGLAIEPQKYFTNELIKNLETNLSDILQTAAADGGKEPIFSRTTFKRVPTLKHLARLYLIKQQDTERIQRQKRLLLPETAPASLNLYMNRKILDQIELFS